MWSAALKLAAAGPWKDVTLQQIASEAGLSLAELAEFASSRAEVLRLFQRHNDREFLASLQDAPLEGSAHDRLFDAMLRRIELLEPHKQALRNIASHPANSPAEWMTLVGSAVETQNWLLLAAETGGQGITGELHRLGLAKIYSDVLKVWLSDNDPGLSRTMAALDRSLRDAEDLSRRIERPLSVISGLARAARSFRTERKRETSTSDTTAD